MRKAGRAILAIVCLVIILVIGGAYAAYFYWNARGDYVQVSPTGNLGFGTQQVWLHTGRMGTGPLQHIGTQHSFFFVRDLAYLPPPPGARMAAPGGPPMGGPMGAHPMGGPASGPRSMGAPAGVSPTPRPAADTSGTHSPAPKAGPGGPAAGHAGQ